jgi:ribosomal protein L32
MAVPKKRTSKSKKNIRKSAWKRKVEKQVTKCLFLANYLINNKPEDPATEKLIKRLNENQENITEIKQDRNSET